MIGRFTTVSRRRSRVSSAPADTADVALRSASNVFQALFGMIFTVSIALELKRSLLVLAERIDSVVQVRAVLLIALLAKVRKLIPST